jgi:hypothetical protein
MESVGAGGGAEGGGGVRVGASAPPGCYRAWPPPLLRPTDVAGPPCAGSIYAAGRPAAAPATAWVSVRRGRRGLRKPKGPGRAGRSASGLRQFASLSFPSASLPFWPPFSQTSPLALRGPEPASACRPSTDPAAGSHLRSPQLWAKQSVTCVSRGPGRNGGFRSFRVFGAHVLTLI